MRNIPLSSFFISYQNESSIFAHELKEKIEDARMTVWLYEKDLRLGDKWKPVIDQAIIECKAVIVVVTLQALRSQYVTYEWAFALGKEKRIIPIILEKPDPKNDEHPPMHPQLIEYQYGDFQDSNNRPWEQLIRELQEIEKQADIPQEVADAEKALYSHNPIERQNAINFLKNYEHPSASEALARAASSQSPETSMAAGLALAEKSNYQDDRAIPGLSRAIFDSKLAPQGIAALGRMNNAKAVSCLAEAFHSSRIQDYRVMSIQEVMARITDTSVIPELRKILLSDKAIHLAVVDALGNFQDPQSVPELIHILRKFHKTDSNFLDEVRIVNALEKIGDREAVKALCSFGVILLNRSAEKDIQIWSEISNVLERLTPDITVPELTIAFQSDTASESAKQNANFLLTRIHRRYSHD